MTTTDSTSTPLTTWSGVDVLYAVAGGGGPQVTVWTQEATGDDAVARVAAEHADTVRSDGEWDPGEAREELDDTGSALTMRSFRPLTDVDPSAAAAAYWSAPGGVSLAVARGPDGDELLDVLRQFVSASRPTHRLSAEEVIALSEVTGLATPPVSPAAYPPEASDDVRAAAHAAARSSLVARGLLVGVGGTVAPSPDLARILHVLLAGERSLLVSREAGDGSGGCLLGGSGRTVAQLTPGPAGTLELSVAGAATAAARHAAWLARGVAPRSDAAPFRASLDEVRECVGSATGPDALRGARALLSVKGLRRRGDEVSAFDATWVQDSTGALWAVSPIGDLTSLQLAPVDERDVVNRLCEALEVPLDAAPATDA